MVDTRVWNAAAAPVGSAGADSRGLAFPLPAGAIACPPYDHVRVLTGELTSLLREELGAFAATAMRTPFQANAWARAFRQAESGETRIPVEAIAYADGKPVVVLPLVACTAPGFRYLTWQAHTPSDYCAPLVAPHFAARFEASDAAALMRAVAREIGGIDLVYLPKMPDRLGEIRNPLVLAESWSFYAGAHAIAIEGDNAGDKTGDWESFYASIRSQRTRHTLKRKEKALMKMGTVDIVIAHDAEQVGRIAQACVALKAGQLARDGHGNLFADQRLHDALIQGMRDACPRGAWAASIELDGRVIAAAFGLIDGDEWLLYQFAMSDGPEAKSSPGQLLLVHLLKECVKRGVRKLDLALGDEAYKFDWCNIHNRLMTSVLPMTPTGHLAALTLRMRERARVWLARNPSTLKLAKRIKPMLKRAGVSA
jgi:CelD/BcsL family acetyltransferase involved in cellulose biosynthesis